MLTDRNNKYAVLLHDNLTPKSFDKLVICLGGTGCSHLPKVFQVVSIYGNGKLVPDLQEYTYVQYLDVHKIPDVSRLCGRQKSSCLTL